MMYSKNISKYFQFWLTFNYINNREWNSILILERIYRIVDVYSNERVKNIQYFANDAHALEKKYFETTYVRLITWTIIENEIRY